MLESDFEGTLVLERLAEVGKLDEFMEAVDSDDINTAKALLIFADLEPETISMVLKKMNDADGE